MKHNNPWLYRIVGVIVICVLLFVGFWNKSHSSTTSVTSSNSLQGERPITVEFSAEDLDSSWDTSDATKINFTENGITVDGSGASVDGNVVTIIYGGVYELSGSMSNGQLVVDSNDSRTVHIVLNGVELTSLNSAPIYVKEAEKTILTLAEHTINKLVDGTNYILDGSEDDEPASIFSKDDLVINGNGTLDITGQYSHGIVSKDDLTIISGTINVSAVQDGIRGRDSIEIKDGFFNITAGNDGIKSNNDLVDQEKVAGYVYIENGQFMITSAHDGIQAVTHVVIIDGDFNIVANGGSANGPERTEEMMGFPGDGGGMRPQNMDADSADQGANTQQAVAETEEVETGTTESDSYKGIKSAGVIWIEQGQFTFDTADDSIHADKDISILDGTFTISSGDDAIHADNNLTLYNGIYNIVKAYEGIEGLAVKIYDGDYQINVTDDGINTGAGTEEAGAPAMGGTPGTDTSNGKSAPSMGVAPEKDTNNGTGAPVIGGGGFGGGMMEASDGSSLDIYGGNIIIYSGGDGLDSNGDLTIYGGNIVTISDSSIGGDGGIDTSGSFTINGGTILGAGPYEAKPEETSTQASIFYSASNASPEGAKIDVYDGETLLYTFTSDMGFTNVFFSSDQLTVDGKYDLRVNDTANELTAQLVPEGTGEMGGRGMGGGFGGGGRGFGQSSTENPAK